MPPRNSHICHLRARSTQCCINSNKRRPERPKFLGTLQPTESRTETLRGAAKMCFYYLTCALVGSPRYLVLAQQSCYWPNGSDANSTASCSSTEDIVCCQPGDVCLSNGLCYGPGQGTVRSKHYSSRFDPQFSMSGKSQILNERKKTYRSACTVRDWSNRTVCPMAVCNGITQRNQGAMVLGRLRKA